MCTNRADALDPAIRRQAAVEFDIARPNDTQRAAVLTAIFDGVGLSDRQIAELVELTRPNGRGYGYTYSDLIDWILAATCLTAHHPDRPITAGLIAEQIHPIETEFIAAEPVVLESLQRWASWRTFSVIKSIASVPPLATLRCRSMPVPAVGRAHLLTSRSSSSTATEIVSSRPSTPTGSSHPAPRAQVWAATRAYGSAGVL
jgi:hypothetical protein